MIVTAVIVPAFSLKLNSEPEREKFTTDKFIVKAKSSLKISEATGKISLVTGFGSLDRLISKFNIRKIENIFKSNNGDAALFSEMEMDKYYLFYTDKMTPEEIKNISESFNKDENNYFSELNYIGEAAGRNDIEEGQFYPNDEYFYKQWYLQNSGSINPSNKGQSKAGADINMVKAWDVEKGSGDVIVAILDSGIRNNHPELKNRIWVNTQEIPDNGIDDDGNGYIDDYKGWDFAYDDNNTEDGFGHGTNIASIIGSESNNDAGFAGINFKCKLMNCKNLSSNNSGEYVWWAESIKYAVDNGAKIINMSEGGDSNSKTLKVACEYAIKKGVMINAAMMNKGDDQDYFPASYKGVFAVGATDTDDGRCTKFSWGGGSCWGEHISVVAPGNKIYGLDYEDITNFDSYWSGTSQSTAMVSGLASLLLSQNSNRSTEEIKNIITSTARDQIGDPREDKAGWDPYYGFGRIDAYLALTFDKISSGNNKNEKTQVKEKEDKDPVEDQKIPDNDKGSAKKVDPKANVKKDKNDDDDKRAKKVDQ